MADSADKSSRQASRAQTLRDMGLTPWVQRVTSASALTEVAAASDEPVKLEIVRAAPPAKESTSRDESVSASAEQAMYSNWPALEQAVSQCTRCALAQGRQQTVFGVGARDARWLLVGEAPGAEEDKRGEPFVGRAGTLLDAMLGALGVERNEVFITNIVKCRPPGNRDPKQEEAKACHPYLKKQIEWVAPELILALGRVAAQQLLGVDTPVGRMRGRVHDGPCGCPIVVTYHPAYLLRTPIAKRKVWEDLKLALTTAKPR